MNQEEMLKMLDLDASPIPQESGAIRIESKTQANKPSVPKDENALVLDRWNRRQGIQIRDRVAGELAAEGNRRPIHDMTPVDLADLHQSVFDPAPDLVQDNECSDQQKYNYFSELWDTPEFHELRQSTVLDDTTTELAIERLSEGLFGLRKQNKNSDGDGESGDDGFAAGRAAGRAVKQATKDVQDLQDAREAMGIGTGPGVGGQYDVKQTIELYKRMRNNSDLQKIINLAGKYRLFGQSQQRRKVAHGRDDMVGVSIGNSLPLLTQSEFLSLGIPELEDDVCRRLLDNQAMIQEWCGQEPVAKGPMILCIDESGSMTNPSSDGLSRIQHAKALALSFAYLARQQGRFCALVAFSGIQQRRSVVLAPVRWNQEALITWLTEFMSGGTVPPIDDMPEIYDKVGAPTGKTDLVYITDGSVFINPKSIDGFNVWKQQVNAKVVTLVISANVGDMTKISDEIHEISTLGFNEATARVLSL